MRTMSRVATTCCTRCARAGGSRADGVKEDVFGANVHRVLEAHRARRREKITDRMREALGRGEGAVTTLADVVEVLRRGQVAELLFTEDAAGRPAALDERQVWTGAGPLDIALRRRERAALGVPSGEARQGQPAHCGEGRCPAAPRRST